MSLGIAIVCPEGVVLAADTRLTLTWSNVSVTYDNVRKLLPISHRVAAVTYGQATINGRSAYSFLPELRQHIERDKPTTVKGHAQITREFFHSKWEEAGAKNEEAGMSFTIAGIDDRDVYGQMWPISNILTPPGRFGVPFGIYWGGQYDLVARLVKGYDPSLIGYLQGKLPNIDTAKILQDWENAYTAQRLPYSVLPLQDSIDLAACLIRTTATLQSLSLTSRGVGGTIEIATITNEEGFRWVQKRETRGE